MSYFDVSGDLVRPNDLEISKAKDLALSLSAERIDFARFVECRKRVEIEIVVFDVEVEIAQVQRHPIKAKERISASFTRKDDNVPVVHARRRDFPRVPHLNLHLQEFPRNLCLYEEPYEEIERRWTSPRFVHDIRRWLALTSQGKLHQDDQRLEPLLVNFDGHIVLPSLHWLEKCGLGPLPVRAVNPLLGKGLFLVADSGEPEEGSVKIVASVHCSEPQKHGLIHRMPRTLADLAAIAALADFDLIADLRHRLRAWCTDNSSALDAHLLLVILFPKQRYDKGAIEAVDIWAFFLSDTEGDRNGVALQIRQLGTKIGVWETQENDIGLLLPPDTSKNGETVGVAVLNVVHHVDRSMAAWLNGENDEDDISLVAIGLGALGSEVVINLSRCGFGTWTLVDHDILLPHNLARHALDGSYVGWNKAIAVAYSANTIVNGTGLFNALPVNVLSPGRQTQELSNSLANADVILDMSASVGVARMLAQDCDSTARRISLFLSPSGNDLVLIAEDKQRDMTVDALEMQYYRVVLNSRCLSGHLDKPPGRYRYAQSCRDITTRLPQHMVGLHASNGGRAVRDAVRCADAQITIWRSNEDGVVKRVTVSPAPVVRKIINDWTIVTDNVVLETLSRLRQSKLPNETGGVLLGSFDMERRIVYIVDALPSPPDSEEWPTLYIRGCEGLAEKVTHLSKIVHGMIEYVGEWHSHPSGAGTKPSKDDLKVLAWLEELMQADGYPATMTIVGEGRDIGFYIGKTEKNTFQREAIANEQGMAQLPKPE